MCVGAHNDFIAIIEKAAGLAGWQVEGFATALARFEQTAESAGCRAGNSAGPEQIAGAKIAAAACVMRNELPDGPIQMTGIRLCDEISRQSLLPYGLGQQ